MNSISHTEGDTHYMSPNAAWRWSHEKIDTTKCSYCGSEGGTFLNVTPIGSFCCCEECYKTEMEFSKEMERAQEIARIQESNSK